MSTSANFDVIRNESIDLLDSHNLHHHHHHRTRQLSQLEKTYIVLTVFYSMAVIGCVIFFIWLLIKFGAAERPHHWPIFGFVIVTGLTLFIPIYGLVRRSPGTVYAFSTFLLIITVIIVVQFIRKQDDSFRMYIEDAIVIMAPAAMASVGFLLGREYSTRRPVESPVDMELLPTHL